MNSEEVINKVLRDLRLFDIIPEEKCGEARPHLERLYTAAWEEGTTMKAKYNERAVEQYNCKGKKIREYESLTDAAKKLKCHRITIYRSIKYNRLTLKGHYWKFKGATESTVAPHQINEHQT